MLSIIEVARLGYHGDKIKKELEKTKSELELDEGDERREKSEEKEEEMREKGREDEEEDEEHSEEKHRERVIVKGYMRPDGTSYYVVIPKEIRELFGLKGGEYFLIKPKPAKGKIELKLTKFVEE
jgi:AbrB family looped-hinge helix DNA binding protein